MKCSCCQSLSSPTTLLQPSQATLTKKIKNNNNKIHPASVFDHQSSEVGRPVLVTVPTSPIGLVGCCQAIRPQSLPCRHGCCRRNRRRHCRLLLFPVLLQYLSSSFPTHYHFTMLGIQDVRGDAAVVGKREKERKKTQNKQKINLKRVRFQPDDYTHAVEQNPRLKSRRKTRA